LMRKLNEFIDSIEDPRLHDANRVVVESRWVPEALAYAGHVVLERWGYEGLKVFLHPHTLDYAEHLALTRKSHETYMGGYMVSWVEGMVGRVLDNIISDFKALLTLVLEKALRDAIALRTWLRVLRGYGELGSSNLGI